MKITINDPREGDEDEIIISCRHLEPEVLKWIGMVKNQGHVVVGYEGDKIHRIMPKDVYYFESVDNKVYAYCKDRVFDTRYKLYELEEMFAVSDFFRASKSMILNIRHIKNLSPAFSGRFEALLNNGEKVTISRQYVKDLKQRLGIGG